MTTLPNPEIEWEPCAKARPVTFAEIQERIGPVEEPPQMLPGEANDNVRLCSAKVLRIYRREKKAVGREAALLRRRWRSFRVPRVFARGPDYLVMENVPLRPVQDGPNEGAQVGRALAEIHSHSYPAAGTLDPDLDLLRRVPDVLAALRERAAGARGADDPLSPLRGAVVAALTRAGDVLSRSLGPAVLLHGDFKPGNFFACGCGDLLILDWERAWAGPALLDVGQLLRWSPSEPFVHAFEASYRAAGGSLPEGWRASSRLLDLPDVLEVLAAAPPGSRRAKDLRRIVEQTLALNP